MGFIERKIRIMLCDRCGESREVEGSSPNPPGWVCAATYPAQRQPMIDAPVALLCPECTSWLRKFFEGRKVAD